MILRQRYKNVFFFKTYLYVNSSNLCINSSDLCLNRPSAKSDFSANALKSHYLCITLHPKSWFDDRLKWEWGENPRLSRSCKSFLTWPKQAESLILLGRRLCLATKSEDLPRWRVSCVSLGLEHRRRTSKEERKTRRHDPSPAFVITMRLAVGCADVAACGEGLAGSP